MCLFQGPLGFEGVVWFDISDGLKKIFFCHLDIFAMALLTDSAGVTHCGVSICSDGVWYSISLSGVFGFVLTSQGSMGGAGCGAVTPSEIGVPMHLTDGILFFGFDTRNCWFPKVYTLCSLLQVVCCPLFLCEFVLPKPPSCCWVLSRVWETMISGTCASLKIIWATIVLWLK